MLAEIRAQIRRWSYAVTADARMARATNYESLATAQVEPPGLEMTRAGKRFLLGNDAAITGIAPVTALPTTAAQWAIFNPAANGVTLYFEELGVYLTSGTPGVSGMLLACLFRTPEQLGASVTGTRVTRADKPNNASGGSGSGVIVKNGVTITEPTAPVWYPIAFNGSANVTAFPSNTSFEHRALEGRISVRPGYGLGLAMVTPAGTSPLFAPFGTWLELQSDVED